MIYYLSVEELKKQDQFEYEQALENAGCDLTPLKALKKVRDMSRMAVAAAPSAQRLDPRQLPSGADQL